MARFAQPEVPPLALIRHTLLFIFASSLLFASVLTADVSAQEPAAEAGAAPEPTENVGSTTSEPMTAETADPEAIRDARAADEASAYAEHESSYAAGEEKDEEEDPGPFPPASHYDIGFTYQFHTDVEDGGSFQMWSGFLDGVYDIEFTEPWSVVTRFDYRADVYDFDGAPPDGTNGFPLLQWGVIHTPRLELIGAYQFGDDWRVYLGAVLEFSFEGGANIRDGFRPGGVTAFEWTITDSLRAGGGVVVVADLDSTAYASPVLLLDWIITDAFALHMESWTTRGGDIELGWQPADSFEIAASLGFRREYYRLNEREFDADPAPGLEDFQPMQISEALVRDRAYTAAARISWHPGMRIVKDVFGDLRIDLDGGVAYLGTLTIDDQDGDQISKQDYDAAPWIGLKLHVPL